MLEYKLNMGVQQHRYFKDQGSRSIKKKLNYTINILLDKILLVIVRLALIEHVV